jgi:hypothetical protein
VNGLEPITYQWRHDGTEMVGQTNAALVLIDLQPENAGMYSVIVSNPAGTVVSEPASLLVFDACLDVRMYAGLNISGQPGETYTVRYTTDLTNTNFFTWTPLATQTLSSSNWFLLDLGSPGSPIRFYGVKKNSQ